MKRRKISHKTKMKKRTCGCKPPVTKYARKHALKRKKGNTKNV